MAGLVAGIAPQAFADSLTRSPVPPFRPLRPGATPADVAEALIAEAQLGGEVAFALADLKTGAMIAERGAGRPMPPASTIKAITSLYALDRLGPAYRFTTRLLASGPVAAGHVGGDLILAGGGDPTLTTDDLGDMAAALAAQGIRSVGGRFLVWGGALPYLASIDPGQPDWVGYNPAVGGLNLNFNRVHFTWTQTGGAIDVGFDARAERFAPAVQVARMEVVDREAPLFTYALKQRREDWTVARQALNREGSRWLPVRRPDLYAGDVFRTLARAQGIDLPEPEAAGALPDAARLVEHASAPLPEILRDMMRFSTNMTAEAVGMAAGQERASSHAASAHAMAGWLASATGRPAPDLFDHSGLGGGSRVTAGDMVRALVRLGPARGLAGLMKPVKFKDAADLGAAAAPVRLVAKTGTLNFVAGLAGYLTTAAGEEKAFAIYAADVARRDAVPAAEREDPPGVRAWWKRARRMELRLIGSWC
jgi:D-alanyl-D-alanine carboxypeptidase/D-alanyl-D-alanine-endopeptidase (penicillin-binding protein 4)